MSLEYLEPVSTEVLESIEGLPEHVLGKNMVIFTNKSGLPDISNIKICLIFVFVNNKTNAQDLFPGQGLNAAPSNKEFPVFLFDSQG